MGQPYWSNIYIHSYPLNADVAVYINVFFLILTKKKVSSKLWSVSWVECFGNEFNQTGPHCVCAKKTKSLSWEKDKVTSSSGTPWKTFSSIQTSLQNMSSLCIAYSYPYGSMEQSLLACKLSTELTSCKQD